MLPLVHMGLLNLNTTILEMKHTKQEKKLSKNGLYRINKRVKKMPKLMPNCGLRYWCSLEVLRADVD